jgi:E3 ubiquitin-protein ligase HUWE1
MALLLHYLTPFPSTKIAIKMSRTSNRNKDTVEGQKAESVSSMGSEEDEEEMEDTGREETPDLYRNSALGMYGGVS